jgi:sulfite exporter TauE/SafE
VRALAELALLATAPLLLLIIRYFSWGAGPLRLLMYALLFAFVGLVTARAGFLRSVWDGRAMRRLLFGAVALLLVLHALRFEHDIARGAECLTDMGRPSICAGEWLLRGLNPWATCASPLTAAERRALPSDPSWQFCRQGDSCIDRKASGTYKNWTHHGPGFDFMDGYKYGPLLALTYAPFVHFWRERGLYLVNLAFWIAQCVLIWLLARAAYPKQLAAPARALLGLLFPLVLPTAAFLPTREVHAFWGNFSLSPPELDTFVLELTRRCSNDVIPVVLVLAATLLAARGKSRAAGVLLGLSLAAKQLPGLLACLVLPRMQGVSARRLWLSACLTALVCYLPFFLWAPREMFANLVLFSLVRPTNSSSIRDYLPANLEPLVSLSQLLLVALVAADFHRRPVRDLALLLRSSSLLAIAFVALNKVVHGNYLLWLQPFIALTLAGRPFRDPQPSAATAR